MNYIDKYESYKHIIEKSLYSYFDNLTYAIPQPLLNAMAYSVRAGGKRIRPVIALAVCDMFGGCTDALLPLACAIEMIHTYSLIHDDLPAMDNDDLRRGLPTNHKVFGESTAILAGDGLLNYSFQILVKSLKNWHAEYPGYFDAVQLITDSAGIDGMIAGQITDIQNEHNPLAGESDLIYVHSKKTGALFKASIFAGAYVSKTEQNDLMALEKFAQQFGLLFQITDDILDIKGDINSIGKTPGKDITSGKLTYPQLYGVEGSKQKAAESANAAIAAIESYGENADFLIHFTESILNRTI